MIAASADDLDTLTRTVWGEARGEIAPGQAAVAWVVITRASWDPPEWWGHTIADACRRSGQFSSWNTNDPNRRLMLALAPSDPLYVSIRAMVQQIVAGTLPDPTTSIGGATTYKRTGTPASWDWAVTKLSLPALEIGHHTFWRLPPVVE